MFDISFAEMMVVAVIALLVIGPEKLPKVARDLGKLVTRAKLYFHSIKTDMSREIRMDELLQIQERIQKQYNLAQDAITNTSKSVNNQVQEINEAVAQTEQTKAPQSITDSISEISSPDEVVTNIAPTPKPKSRKSRSVISSKNATAAPEKTPTVEISPPDELPAKTPPLD